MANFLNKVIDSKEGRIIFPKWNIRSMPKLKANHFLPSDFIQQVENQVGPLYLKVEKKKFNDSSFIESALGKNYSLWTMEIEVNYNDPFIKCIFIVDNKDPRSILVTGLELMNPLPNLKNQRTHLSQDSKGLPFYVFQHLKRQLILFLRAGGYNKVKSNPQNYLVSKLYRKMLGFRARDEKAEKTYLELDNLYKISKYALNGINKLPPMETFSRALGDQRVSYFRRPYSAIIELENELMEKPLSFFDNKTPVYSSEDNHIVGVIVSSPGESQLYYFVPNKKPLKILNWKDLLEEYSLGLIWDI